MDAKQQEKVRIQQRQRQYRILGMVGIILYFAITPSILISWVIWLCFPHIPVSTAVAFLVVCIMVCVGVKMMGVISYVLDTHLLSRMRETDQCKLNWLLHYGIETSAQVVEHKVETRTDSKGVRTPAYFFLLAWQDPRTEQPISLKEQTTQDGFASYPIGSRLPVRYDHDDPTFYAVALPSASV